MTEICIGIIVVWIVVSTLLCYCICWMGGDADERAGYK